MKNNEIAKEMIKAVIGIMRKNVLKSGSNDESFNQVITDVKNELCMTEKGALIMVRAAMSVYTGQLHPYFEKKLGKY